MTAVASFAHEDIRLIRAHSPDIIQQTWTNNRVEWGPSLDEETYYARERILASQEFTRDNKLQVWILVPKTFDSTKPQLDLILSAVETFERSGILASKDQGLKDVLSISVASVFTPAHYRGRGYASLMMKLLWREISNMKGVSFSFLYSDVGPTFYGRLGWTPKRSEEIIIPTAHTIQNSSSAAATDGDTSGEHNSMTVEKVTDSNLSELIAADAEQVRTLLKAQIETASPSKMFAVVTPEPTCVLWLHARARFAAQHILKLEQYQITEWGAKQGKSFVLWFHDLFKDQLFIIRWYLDPIEGDETARALIEAAQTEARKWKLSKVVMWNPDQSLVDLLQLEIKYRDSAIPSLGLVNSTLEPDNVEWVHNEKYSWC
ncbi:hypothetical protein BG015_009510 [Linnemannia schmuckeri]|uniref:LYC1 C-terminal domain-containing protein n=1 Tax=Linnemannia schmuckeri TaxID=64567 RepID=A0A9P5S5K3_9FUNG|nr:hypothetical protein BG015_009510 [Linnemannia schmuckeri]